MLRISEKIGHKNSVVLSLPQSLTLSDPVPVVVLVASQEVQEAEPVVGLYVPTSHGAHGSPL